MFNQINQTKREIWFVHSMGYVFFLKKIFMVPKWAMTGSKWLENGQLPSEWDENEWTRDKFARLIERKPEELNVLWP